MNYERIRSLSAVASIIYMAGSFIELIISLILTFTSITFENNTYTIISLMLNSHLVSIEGIFLWLFLNIVICVFLLYGFLFLRFIKMKKVDDLSLAKTIVLAGMVMLMLTFIKLEYVFLLSKVIISGTSTFQEILYDKNITPLFAAYLWIFYTGVSCGFLIVGITVPAVGLYWVLQLEKNAK